VLLRAAVAERFSEAVFKKLSSAARWIGRFDNQYTDFPAHMCSIWRMRNRAFQLPPGVKPRTRLAIAIIGFVLVHIAAYFLFTATAPYMGSFVGIIGMMLFILGSSKPKKRVPKKTTKGKTGKKYYYLKA
jgi:hypothetical protein